MITREHYIRQIRPFYESDLVKIITGIRRSGKSVIMKQVMEQHVRGVLCTVRVQQHHHVSQIYRVMWIIILMVRHVRHVRRDVHAPGVKRNRYVHNRVRRDIIWETMVNVTRVPVRDLRKHLSHATVQRAQMEQR